MRECFGGEVESATVAVLDRSSAELAIGGARARHMGVHPCVAGRRCIGWGTGREKIVSLAQERREE